MQLKFNRVAIAFLFVLISVMAACTSARQTDSSGQPPVIDLLRDTATSTPFLPLAATPTPMATSVATQSVQTPAATTSPEPTPAATPSSQYVVFEETEFNKTSTGRLIHFAYVCDAGINSAHPGLEFSSVRSNRGDYCTIAPADDFLSADGKTAFAQIDSIHKVEMDVQIGMVKNADGHNPSVGFLYTCANKEDSSTNEFWLAANGAYLFNEANPAQPWSWGAQDENLERVLSVDFDAKTFTLAAANDPQNPQVVKDIFTCADPRGLKFGIFYRNDAAINAVIKRIRIYASAKNPLP